MNESSLITLYQSAVDAFPNTTKRQHATNTIVITELIWTPFIGLKTLFIKGLAQNQGKEYNPIILFKGVNYLESGGTSVIDNIGSTFNLQQLSFENNDVVLRCNCPDFLWRFNFYNHLDQSLYGRKRKKYESHGGLPANPSELPGMCKHLIKLSMAIRESGLIV